MNIWQDMPPSTGSPRGVSTIAKEFECGRAVWYTREGAEQGPADGRISDADKLDPLRVGSCFHWLCRIMPPAEDCATQPDWDAEQVEAARLYNHALENDYFGGLEFTAKELAFVSADEPEAPEYFTGQADAMAVITDGRFNLPIGTKVVVDFKTAKSVNLKSHYTRGPQAHLYLARLRETKQAEAIIFFEITKHKIAKNIVISRYVLQGDTWPMPVLKQWAAKGYEKVASQERNLSACTELNWGRGCPFYGRCMSEALESESEG